MTKQILVGQVPVGGGAPVPIQSMCNTPTADVKATLAQIQELHQAGCQIVRLAVPDMDSVHGFAAIRKESPVPLVADIHFDYRLAVAVVEGGADKVRINPGNIGSAQRVKEVVQACQGRGVPIRIGVNGGSLEKELLAKYGGPTPQAMVASAFGHIRLLEELDFTQICVSLKSSSVRATMEAYRLMSQQSDYPLHIGVTEAGTIASGRMKSAIGIGGLLGFGIGDTLRVSLAAHPVEEVKVAKEILAALGLRRDAPELIACPTCGRTKIDLIAKALDCCSAKVKC